MCVCGRASRARVSRARVFGSPSTSILTSARDRYFAAFLAAVGVSTNVTFVCHSWGGTLAAYWGANHPDAVVGLVPMEVVYKPFDSWEAVPKKIRGGVKLSEYGGCNKAASTVGGRGVGGHTPSPRLPTPQCCGSRSTASAATSISART